MYCRKN